MLIDQLKERLTPHLHVSIIKETHRDLVNTRYTVLKNSAFYAGNMSLEQAQSTKNRIETKHRIRQLSRMELL